MGRTEGNGKAEADDLKKINIFWLKRNNYLSGFVRGIITWSYRHSDNKSQVEIQTSTIDSQPYLRITYIQKSGYDNKTDYDYKIPLTKTDCFYGGFRYWFICPWYKNGIYCGRRVATLYLGDKHFACRHCHNLTYASRKTSGMWKSFGSSISIPELEEQRGKMRSTTYAGKPTKRFKMWGKRYIKLCNQLEVVENGLHAVKRTIT